MADLQIRPATRRDDNAIWAILEPVFRAGETYPIDPQVKRDDALAYWFGARKSVFVCVDSDAVFLGTYYLGPNSTGPADHVANCGYATHVEARGRGVATAMASHSFEAAKVAGYYAMQFNLVVATNETAFRLWKKLGMTHIGTISGAFRHKTNGLVDAHIMYRVL